MSHELPSAAGCLSARLLAACLAVLLGGCGGGGSGAPVAAPAANVVPNDTFQAPVLAGNGLGLLAESSSSAGPGAGTIVVTGAAGEGELVQLDLSFPAGSTAAGTMTWRVLRSSYGIEGQSGSLPITRDPRVASGEDGGYQLIGGVAGQAVNLFVARSGQVSGALPLTIGGRSRPTLFSGMRLRDAFSRVADFASTYAYGSVQAEAGTGNHPTATYGTLRLSADGTGRICEGLPYDDGCAGGVPVTAAMDPDHVGVLRITGVAGALRMYAVGRRTAGGRISLAIDMVAPPSAVRPQAARTGAVFAGSIDGAPFLPASYGGAWSFVLQELGSSDFAYAGKASVVGDGRAAAIVDTASGCAAVQHYAFTGGGFTTGVGRTQLGQPVIPLDEDLVLSVDPADPPRTPGSLTLLRRYTTDDTKAPCAVR